MFNWFGKKQDMTVIFQATDNLARKTCSIGAYLVCEQKNSFLNSSELTRTDAVIFAAFLNHLLIISEVKNKDIGEQVIRRYLAFVCQILEDNGGCFGENIPSTTITEMLNNRLDFYSMILQSKPNLPASIAALVEEFEYIIKTDIIEGEYKPFSKNSPLPILGFEKDISCQKDAMNFPSFATKMLEKPLSELLQLIK